VSAHDAHDQGLPSAEEINLGTRSGWRRAPLMFAALGVAGLAVCGWAYTQNPQAFWFDYLTAAMFWLAFGLGGTFFMLIAHAARSGWSVALRRIAENASLMLPTVAVLLLPVVFVGSHELYEWTHTHVVAEDDVLTAKQPYLNEGAFKIRALLSLGVWSLITIGYWRWSTKQDTARDPVAYTHKMRWFAPLSLIAFAFSLTFGAAFDLIMSLDPHWFSTIFGVYYFAGCVISIHAFLSLAIILLHRAGYLRGVVTIEHFHDLGKMMFAFTVFWAYSGFSQYMLIWYASIPEETYWYRYRGQGDWLTLSLVLIFARFVFPFIGLMSRKIKRNPSTLAFWAVWVLVAQFLDMFWLVQPTLPNVVLKNHDPSLHLGLVDVAAVVGIGGIALAVFTWACNRHPLVPVKDPRLLESINHENF
jgi:hypothetical protein